MEETTEIENNCECNCEEDQFEDENKNIKITIDKVSTVESYLKERRISELIHFLLSKVVAEAPEKPVLYLEKLLNECIGFLAYRSKAPTLYEPRHLEAMIKSFDPCQRKWLSACQIRRLYESVGLKINQDDLEDNIAVTTVLEDLQKNQELALRELLLAGSNKSANSW